MAVFMCKFLQRGAILLALCCAALAHQFDPSAPAPGATTRGVAAQERAARDKEDIAMQIGSDGFASVGLHSKRPSAQGELSGSLMRRETQNTIHEPESREIGYHATEAENSKQAVHRLAEVEARQDMDAQEVDDEKGAKALGRPSEAEIGADVDAQEADDENKEAVGRPSKAESGQDVDAQEADEEKKEAKAGGAIGHLSDAESGQDVDAQEGDAEKKEAKAAGGAAHSSEAESGQDADAQETDAEKKDAESGEPEAEDEDEQEDLLAGDDDSEAPAEAEDQAARAGNVLMDTGGWSGWFSEEGGHSSGHRNNPVNMMQCSGGHCDNLRVHWDTGRSMTGGTSWTGWFSEEHGIRECAGGQGVTQIQCAGSKCDNLRLGCQPPHSTWQITGHVIWTGWFSEEGGGLAKCPANTVLGGIHCGGSYCDNKRMACRRWNMKPINCAWRSWGSWGDCSKSCGGGSRTRTRTNSGAPQHGGAACVGETSNVGKCNEEACPTTTTTTTTTTVTTETNATVEAKSGAPPRAVRAGLCGSALGAALIAAAP